MLCFKLFVLFFVVLGIEGGEYTYCSTAGGSFKLHRRPATWREARMRCHLEGAVLASPLNAHMWYEIIRIGRAELRNYADAKFNIFVGFHATFSKGDFYSIEGVHIDKAPISFHPLNFQNKADCVILNSTRSQFNETSCDNTFSYLCFKKGVPKTTEIGPCGAVDNGYKLDNRTRSCYKFHTTARPWSRAFMACSVENAHLAVINSDDEATFLQELFVEYPEDSIMAPNKNYAYVGVQDWGELGDWQTIHGESLQAAGYWRFASGAPYFVGGCLVVGRTNFFFSDVKCDSIYPFFCEKPANN